jgi:hypothetical protein
MHAPAVDVRAKVVWSLARIGPSAGIDWGPIQDAGENDPAIEVRTAAMNSLATGWPQHFWNLESLRNKDVLGR